MDLATTYSSDLNSTYHLPNRPYAGYPRLWVGLQAQVSVGLGPVRLQVGSNHPSVHLVS